MIRLVHRASQGRVDATFLRRQEMRLRNLMQASFKVQLKWVLKNARQLHIFDGRRDSRGIESRAPKPENEIDKMLESIPEVENQVAIITASAEPSMLKGALGTIKKLKLAKFGISFNMRNTRAERYIKQKKNFLLSDRKGTITYKTKKDIKKILLDAFREGLSYTDAGELIERTAKAGVFSRARAELVAITEIGQAHGEGSKIPIDDFLAGNPDRTVQKEWVTVGDDRVRPTHSDNQAAGWIHSGEKFPGTDEDHAPSTDFRCRCFTNYRLVQ